MVHFSNIARAILDFSLLVPIKCDSNVIVVTLSIAPRGDSNKFTFTLRHHLFERATTKALQKKKNFLKESKRDTFAIKKLEAISIVYGEQ